MFLVSPCGIFFFKKLKLKDPPIRTRGFRDLDYTTAGPRFISKNGYLLFLFIAYFCLIYIICTLILISYLIVDAGAPEESIVNKEDSLNISSIVIGVIAVVIFACLIVVIIFLVKKIRDLKKERLDSQYKITKRKLDHLMVEKTNLY